MLWAKAESPSLPALFITSLNSLTSSVSKCPSVVWPWIWRKQRWWRQLSTSPVEVRGKGFYFVWGNTFSSFSCLCFIYPYLECVLCVWGGSQVCHGGHVQLRRQLFGGQFSPATFAWVPGVELRWRRGALLAPLPANLSSRPETLL